MFVEVMFVLRNASWHLLFAYCLGRGYRYSVKEQSVVLEDGVSEASHAFEEERGEDWSPGGLEDWSPGHGMTPPSIHDTSASQQGAEPVREGTYVALPEVSTEAGATEKLTVPGQPGYAEDGCVAMTTPAVHPLSPDPLAHCNTRTQRFFRRPSSA